MFWCFHVLQRVLSRHISPFPWEKTLGELLTHFGAASLLTSGIDTCWDYTLILPDRRHLRRENGSLQGASAPRRSEEICCVWPEGAWWCVLKERFLDSIFGVRCFRHGPLECNFNVLSLDVKDLIHGLTSLASSDFSMIVCKSGLIERPDGPPRHHFRVMQICRLMWDMEILTNMHHFQLLLEFQECMSEASSVRLGWSTFVELNLLNYTSAPQPNKSCPFGGGQWRRVIITYKKTLWDRPDRYVQTKSASPSIQAP